MHLDSQKLQQQYQSVLNKHVHSLIPTHSFYSSNQQPPLPSILTRSRSKRSHQKSIKKGISRVSQSKYENSQKQILIKQKQKIKGTLLNFNVQDVMESNFHLKRPKQEIIQQKQKISPQKSNQPQTNILLQSSPYQQFQLQRSNQKPQYQQQLDQYRIVTYVPSGYQHQKSKLSDFYSVDEKNLYEKQENQNQQRNNIIQSNKSEDVQVFNGQNTKNQFIQNLHTQKTQQNQFRDNSQSYLLKQNQPQMKHQTKMNHQFKKQQQLKQKYIQQKMNKLTDKNIELKQKIKHLEREIIEIERVNSKLIEEKEQNQRSLNRIVDEKESLERKIQSFQAEYTKEIQQRNLQFKKNVGQDDLTRKVDQLQLLNAKLSKQLSQKNLLNTTLTSKVRQLQDKIKDYYEKKFSQFKTKIQSFEQKLYRKDEKINQISLQNDRLGLQIEDLKKNIEKQKQFYKKVKLSEFDNNNVNEYNKLKQNHQQLERDYMHLEKKNLFMKDQLDHLKYLQKSSSTNVYVNSSKFASGGSMGSNDEGKLVELKQKEIKQLKMQYDSTLIMFQETQKQYLNLRGNFKALQELYISEKSIKDQQQAEINRLKTQKASLISQVTLLSSQQTKKLQFYSNKIQFQRQRRQQIQQQLNQLRLKYQQKQQIILGLKIQLKNQETRYYYDYNKSKQERDKLALDFEQYKNLKNNEFNMKIQEMSKQYQDVINKMDEQIIKLREEIQKIKSANKQNLHQQIHSGLEQSRRVNEMINRKHQKHQKIEKQSSSYLNRSFHNKNIFSSAKLSSYELLSRKQLETLIHNLQDDLLTLEQKYKTIIIQKQSLEDSLNERERKLTHFQEEIKYYKENKETGIRERVALCAEVEQAQRIVKQIKEKNQYLELNNQILKQKNQQLSLLVEDLTNEAKENKQKLINYEQKIGSLDILLQKHEKQLNQKNILLRKLQQANKNTQKQLTIIKEQKQTHRSKEEYYKNQYQLKQKQINLILQQNKIISQTKQHKSLSSRETELYRIEIYKQLNNLLKLSSHMYSFEQIISTNEQSYLKKLYQTIKQQIIKHQQLRIFVENQQKVWGEQKQVIKIDYNVVYDKYLKYKNMCKQMQGDIDKYKEQLKRRKSKEKDHVRQLY